MHQKQQKHQGGGQGAGNIITTHPLSYIHQQSLNILVYHTLFQVGCIIYNCKN